MGTSPPPKTWPVVRSPPDTSTGFRAGLGKIGLSQQPAVLTGEKGETLEYPPSSQVTKMTDPLVQARLSVIVSIQWCRKVSPSWYCCADGPAPVDGYGQAGPLIPCMS